MISGVRTYHSTFSSITFQVDDAKRLSVSIDTKDLHIRSVEESDFPSYVSLFADQTTMATFGDGKTKTEEKVRKSFENYARARAENNPYDRLTTSTRNNNFVGTVALTPYGAPGVAELGIASLPDYWKQGFGTKAAVVIVKEYAPATVKEGYLIQGKPLDTIVATARPDNSGSIAIIEGKLGMQFQKEEFNTLYQGMRRYYFSKI